VGGAEGTDLDNEAQDEDEEAQGGGGRGGLQERGRQEGQTGLQHQNVPYKFTWDKLIR
jgi:hypothetical protein